METSSHVLDPLNGKPCSRQIVSVESSSDKCSGYCHLSSQSLDRAEKECALSVYCTSFPRRVVSEGLSTDQEGESWVTTYKTKVGSPGPVSHQAVELCRRSCLLQAGATVLSCSHPQLCLLSFLMSTVTHHQPCQNTHCSLLLTLHQHHLFIWPSQRLGSSLTPLSPSPPS